MSANQKHAVRRAAIAVALLIGLTACNPLLTDPDPLGFDIDETSARYGGPDAAWLEITASGAPDHVVYAFALIEFADLHGPTSRSCAGATVTSCTVTVSDVRMPDQRLVPGDGSASVRLMQLWSGETVQVALVCVDADSQELGCPATLRTALRTVDGSSGGLVGALVPAA